MKKVLSFDDTLILPRFSEVRSRKECDTTVDLNGLILSNPIISANMDTITGSTLANAMVKAGGIGCLHRFHDVQNNVAEFLRSNKNAIVSVGVTEDERRRVEYLSEAGAKYWMIDVANGASQAAVQMYVNMRQKLGADAWIAVGNFGTYSSFDSFMLRCSTISGYKVDLPNSIKVGIGGGSMCTTRIVTGCGLPTLASLLDFYEHPELNGWGEVKIIADGGIKNSGDIAKALAAGADAVMVGSLLSGTLETPSVEEYIKNQVHMMKFQYKDITDEDAKERILKYYIHDVKIPYRGSASSESYAKQGKIADHRSPEGVSTEVKYKGPVEPILQQLRAGLQSAMSYVNAFTIEEFKENAELVEITNSGMTESKAHGVK